MRLDLLFRRVSLKGRLISNYLVILGIGGLVTSLVGSWIVSSTIMAQARRSVVHDLATAHTLYGQRLELLERTVELAASGGILGQPLCASDPKSLHAHLEPIRRDANLDFLSLTDDKARVILRVAQGGRTGDDVSSISVVKAALAGRVAAATEVLPAPLLGNENPALPAKAHFRFVPTPHAKPVAQTEESSGMVLLAAAPVRGPNGRVLGALYGGVLLNRNLGIVDRVWEVRFKGDRYDGQDVGSVTIFQNDLRISTSVKTAGGERALGTRASAEVRDAVLGRGETFLGRAFVVNDWYIAGYEPVRNFSGRTIGMLYVGLLEKAYTATRNRVILSFFAIATLGFIFIIGITYYEISNITRPLAQMVAATQSISAGRFDQKVEMGTQGEIAQLAASFNAMLESLRQMKADLEDWARTLEQKVKERTEELVAMQVRVAQSERLASLGMLAAGVAHEINNPLGGILSLSALSLEDMAPDDPNRENLEEVVKQTQRCRAIVKGLLEFSRGSTGHPDVLDLNKSIEDALALVGKQAAFFNVTVVQRLDPGLPPVMGDKSAIQQVFMNILVNAAQAMEERGTVTITTRRAAGDFADVLISDTGCGIPPEQVRKIFDPFFTTKASGRGTGLGLSIAYGIVTAHRGTILVESEVGKGTTFTVRMPVASEENSGAEAASRAAEA